MQWTPGRSKQRRALEDPYEGVPDHLQQLLWNWVEAGLLGQSVYGGYDTARVQALSIALRTPLSQSDGQQIERLSRAGNEDQTVLLDMAEAMLELYGWDRGRAGELAALLDSTNSAYAVNDASNGLEFRIAPGVKAAVQSSVDAAGGSAGEHLTAAWNEAYGRNPDPVKSYSESIKAAGTVSPDNTRATLSSMIRDVSAKPEKWQFVGKGSGVTTVLAMMRALWDGQTSRHGGVTPTRAETLEEARTALHLAAALVQFGASGAFDVTS